MDFISIPVVSAFSTSTALLIIVSQTKNLLGIKFKAKNLPMTILSLSKNINQIKVGDTLLGIGAIIFLMTMKVISCLDNFHKLNFYYVLEPSKLWRENQKSAPQTFSLLP